MFLPKNIYRKLLTSTPSRVMYLSLAALTLTACNTTNATTESHHADETPGKILPNENRTVLSILVLADGSVGDIKVLDSSGDKQKDDAAVDFYRKRARFIPAVRDGKPIDAWKDIAVSFKTKQETPSKK